MPLPVSAEDVLRDPRYWTTASCRQFLEHCDTLLVSNPERGDELCETATRLVAQVEAETSEPQPGLQARVLVLRGTVRQLLGDPAGAQTLYKEAQQLYRWLPEPLAKAELFLRLVVVHGELRQWDEVIEFAARAGSIFLAAGDTHSYGRVLRAKAEALSLGNEPTAALPIFARALARLDYDQSPQTFDSTIRSFAAALAKPEPTAPEHLDAAIEWLREARRVGPARAIESRSLGYRKRSIPDAKLRYVLGLVLYRRGQPKKALRLLESAHAEFIEIGRAIDIVEVSLDLGALYAKLGRGSDLQHLVHEAIRLLAHFPEQQSLQERLLSWQDALLTGKAVPDVAELRRTLLAHLADAASGELGDRAVHKRLITRLVKQAIVDSRSLEELKERLLDHDVTVHLRPSQKGRPPGIAFALRGHRYTGHELGRRFRLSQIQAEMSD